MRLREFLLKGNEAVGTAAEVASGAILLGQARIWRVSQELAMVPYGECTSAAAD